ncbi:MAG: hypothetical protein U0X75_28145 [Acidobacteriota bacterium]
MQPRHALPIAITDDDRIEPGSGCAFGEQARNFFTQDEFGRQRIDRHQQDDDLPGFDGGEWLATTRSVNAAVIPERELAEKRPVALPPYL